MAQRNNALLAQPCLAMRMAQGSKAPLVMFGHRFTMCVPAGIDTNRDQAPLVIFEHFATICAAAGIDTNRDQAPLVISERLVTICVAVASQQIGSKLRS